MATEPSLYHRLGGYDVLARIVDGFLARLHGDPVLTRFGLSMNRERQKRNRQLTLDYLPDHYGKALEWKYLEGLSVEEIAARLNVSEGAVKVAVHRLRRRYGMLLRAAIAETVSNEADLDDEMRYLVAVLRRR